MSFSRIEFQGIDLQSEPLHVEPADLPKPLRDAVADLKREMCGAHGHDWDVVVKGSGEPQALFCSYCGRMWTVSP